MASFSIPLVFTIDPKPEHHFTLDVPNARKHPDLIGDFSKKTWSNFNDRQRFLDDQFRNSQRPSLSDILAQRRPTFRRKRFKPFSRLPVELQEQIWESCLEPVTHTAICLVEVGAFHDRILAKTWLLESPGKRSDRRSFPVPLFHICRQSRAVAKRFYRLLEPGVYFSPVIDTLRVSIISDTKIDRMRHYNQSTGTIQYFYSTTSHAIGGPLFSGEAYFRQLRYGSSRNSNCNYVYHLLYREWAHSYETHLHEYGPPYILTLIPQKILQEIQNLEILFFYQPLMSIENQHELSHLHTYLVADHCPIMDLTGLRRLVLKAAVIKFDYMYPPEMFPPEIYSEVAGLNSWGEMVQQLLALHTVVNRKKDKTFQRQDRGLRKLQTLEIIKTCAIVGNPFYICENPMTLSARWSRAKRRALIRMSKKNWRPS